MKTKQWRGSSFIKFTAFFLFLFIFIGFFSSSKVQAAGPTFVQVVAAQPQTNQTTVTVKFTKAQGAGDTNILAIGWSNTTANITSVTDSAGNAYTVAAATVHGSSQSQAIYYTKNIVGSAANANTVTVKFSSAAKFVDLRASEYSGLDKIAPFDKSASGIGSSATAATASVTTTSPNELIFGAGDTSGVFSAAGTGFTKRIITNPDSDITEDKTVTAIGSYNATANQSGSWVMQVATFKVAITPTATPTPLPTAIPTPLPTATPTPLPTATPTPLPTDTPTPTPATPNVTLYGAAGTFGQLASVSALPTGQTLQTIGVTNWGFNPGESEFFSALAPDGEIVLGTNPQTDNEVYATADQMNLGVFDPVANTFRTIIVPTSNGTLHVTNPFSFVGGASVDGLITATVNGQPKIAFTSAVNYNGWDVNAKGEYPAVGFLDVPAGAIQYNPTLSLTADQISSKSALGASSCPSSNNIFNQQVSGCRGFAEMGQLPLSQNFVITQYFASSGNHSGNIVVMSPDGTVLANYQYPNISNGSGGFYNVNPREVDVDPTSVGNLEYFAVIFDVGNPDGTSGSFPLQEFAFNRTTNQIIPISAPVLSGGTNGSGQPYRFETAKYDSFGNLWATQAVTNSLAGGPIVVYANNAGVRTALEQTCAVPSDWSGANWQQTCTPDKIASNTDAYGQTRSFTEDPQTHTMFAATIANQLLRVKQSGSGAGLTLTTLPAINIDLDAFRAISSGYIGVRKGVVDPATRSLYIPVVQVYSPAVCSTWPSTTPCTPIVLNQWLYRFDLNALSN